MILYRLKCKRGHVFEAWFASGAAYDKQAKHGELSCPQCGTAQVSKAAPLANQASNSWPLLHLSR